MSTHPPKDDPREPLAEAIVFAHEFESRAIETPAGVSVAERTALERTAALTSAACASSEPLPVNFSCCRPFALIWLRFCAN